MCPFCDKAFRWKSQQAGRKVACPQCSGQSRVPAEAGLVGEPVQPPPADEVGGDYELDLPASDTVARDSKPPSHNGQCPACNASVKPAAVLCINCGYHLTQGQRLETAVGSAAATGSPASSIPQQTISADKLNSPFAQLGVHRGVNADAMAQDMEDEHHWKEFKLPCLLVLAGVILMLLNAGVMAPLAYSASDFSAYSNSGPWWYGAYRLIYAVIRLAVQVPAMLVGILLTARIFGSNFGSLGTALLKLIAIVLITGGAEDFVGLGLDYLTNGWGAMIGSILLWAFSFGVFYVTCISQLETEPLETIILYVVVIYGPAFLAGFLAFGVWSLLA